LKKYENNIIDNKKIKYNAIILYYEIEKYIRNHSLKYSKKILAKFPLKS